MKADNFPLLFSFSVNPWYQCFKDSSDAGCAVCSFSLLPWFFTPHWF